MQIPLQVTSQEIYESKYQLKDYHGKPVDKDVFDTFRRVAKALGSVEENSEYWEDQFYYAMTMGATPAGRIMANAGAEKYKPSTSTINCTVSSTVKDSMVGIMDALKDAAVTLKSGCGVGYEFSTLRPRGAFVAGAGATTSGPMTFMDVFDKMCFTVSSAGGRRGAQMATFAVWHPDVEEFIQAKREDGRLRQFNLSLLIDDDFMKAVRDNQTWDLIFPVTQKEIELGLQGELVEKDMFWDREYIEQQGYLIKGDKVVCKIYKTLKAVDLWDMIMKSTYDYAEPGFLLIDSINKMNPLHFCEVVRATNPCGEQPLPPHGACLLGSLNVVNFVTDPFTKNAKFDWDEFKKVVRIFTRMLDNVVDNSGLPLEQQRHEIEYKRRHGMGYLGLGSTMTMLGMTYGDSQSIAFTDDLTKVMAVEGLMVGVELAKEKGMAPIFKDGDNLQQWVNSPYMQRIWGVWPEGKALAMVNGCRFTHHTSIAPTGTISLSINNNVSNGIEPTFSHKYLRNVIEPGKKSKKQVPVYSYEMLLYKHINGVDEVPDDFSTADSVTTTQHVDIQAAAQYWVDSSISKTINVPTNMKFEDFKGVYQYAYDKGLKGCTTFRFNPEAFSGVLVNAEDVKNTMYSFTLKDGSVVEVSGDTVIEYDGETHTASNLYDAIKEGYFGKF